MFLSQVNCTLPKVKKQIKANTNALQKMKLEHNILTQPSFMFEVNNSQDSYKKM